MKSLTIECCDQFLLLTPDKAIHWGAKKTLIVADVHIGKEHMFGRSGISIPGGVSENTIAQLFSSVDQFTAERLLVLGDFIHGYHTKDESWFDFFREQRALRSELSIEIVVGNHDKKQSRALLSEHVTWIEDALHEPPFVFRHEPEPDARGYVMCGHLHPAYMIRSTGKEKLRAPLYWFKEDRAILPAFGQFTGGKVVDADESDRLFIVGPDCVIEV